MIILKRLSSSDNVSTLNFMMVLYSLEVVAIDVFSGLGDNQILSSNWYCIFQVFNMEDLLIGIAMTEILYTCIIAVLLFIS